MDFGNIQIPVSSRLPVKAAQPGQVMVVPSVSDADALENFRRKLAERQDRGMAVSTPVLTAAERLQTLNPPLVRPSQPAMPSVAMAYPVNAGMPAGSMPLVTGNSSSSWAAFTAHAGKNPLQTVAAVMGIAAALKYLFTSQNAADQRSRRD